MPATAGRETLIRPGSARNPMRPGGMGTLVLVAGLVLAGCVNAANDDPSASGTAVTPQHAGHLIIENITTETVEPGVTVTGLLGYMDGTTPTRLVVMAHGYGHNVEQSWAQHVARTVRDDTAVVTTNYRDNDGFPILKGAQDTIQATLDALDRFPSIDTVYLLGISMGGAVSGTAITESIGLGPGGGSLYDHWIFVEGVSMPAETWAEASAIGHPAAGQIEDDAGGTPLDAPDAYLRRSPALRAHEMATGGIETSVVVHGLHDGLVPYNQGREMAKALVAAGIPTSMFTVTRDETGQTSGTTITKDIADVTGLPDPNEDTLDLAGHGSEADYGHPVIRTGFEQLELMLDGTYVAEPYVEHVVDDQL